MTNRQPLEDIKVSNERELQELIWTIKMSEGQFVLILARCNYEKEQLLWMQRLRDECLVKIREVRLEESAKELYQPIYDSVKNETPPFFVTVLGLESVSHLEVLLNSTNLLREEFRKNFSFPLVLWVNDRILQQMINAVPDFKSWSTTFYFRLASDELIAQLQQSVDAVFSNVLDVGACQFLSNATILGRYYHSEELETAISDLHSRGKELASSLKAGVKFLLGRDTSAKGQIEEASSYYQESLNIFRQQNTQEDPSIQNRIGVLFFHIGLCYLSQSKLQQSKTHYLEEAKNYFQQCVEIFEREQRLDLVAKFIGQLGEVLQRLAKWDELEVLAQKSLQLHQSYGTLVQQAQDYGFLAAVALNAKRWNDAIQKAEQAQEILADGTNEALRSHQSLYLLMLAQAHKELNQISSALKYLEEARQKCQPQDDPQLYIEILAELRSLYFFQQRKYVEAFTIKQQQRSIEQQFSIRAFIGAGWLEPQQQAKSTPSSVQHQETIALEISASARQQDVDKLIERMRQPYYKLTVIYGQSGVGKSSIVNAGLVPALKQKTIESRRVLPIVLRVYTNWIGELGQRLAKLTSTSVNAVSSNLIAQLERNSKSNLLTVLIFDQFEEFFFAYPEPNKRQEFFKFLANCLNIANVNVILSLREDYLHCLLEGNRLRKETNDHDILNNILNKNILYYLGNFSRKDAEEIIQRLTERTQFHFESDLIKQLVSDLAGELGEVRPIELQIVGMQLQEQKIYTLNQYKDLGENPKEKLVQSYLDAVIEDCGSDNKNAADLVLYFLTDDKNKRPLKTIDDLKKDLETLPTKPKSLIAEDESLNSVLDIFVRSGLVLLLPEKPAKRYQLVHDYLVELIRRQQEPKIEELYKQLEEAQKKVEEEKIERIEAEAREAAAKGELDEKQKLIEQLNEEQQQREKTEGNLKQLKYQLTKTKHIFILIVLAGVMLTLFFYKRLETTQQKLKTTKLEQTGLHLLQELGKIKQGKDAQFPNLFVDVISQGQNVKELNPGKQGNSNISEQYYDIISSTTLALQQTLEVIQNRKPFQYLIFEQNPILSMDLSPDGRMLAIALGEDNGKFHVVIQDLQSQKTTSLLELKDKITNVQFSPNGQELLTIANHTLYLNDLQGKLIKQAKLDSKVSSFFSIRFSPDSQNMVAVSTDDKTYQYQWEKEKLEEKSLNKDQDTVDAVLARKGQYLITVSRGASFIGLQDLRSKRELRKTLQIPAKSPSGDSITNVSFCADGNLLATASRDNKISLWNLQGQQDKQPLNLGSSSSVSSISCSRNGKRLAIAFSDNTIIIKKVPEQGLRKDDFIPLDLRGDIRSVNFNPKNSKQLATVSTDGKVRLWNLKSEPQGQLLGEQKKDKFYRVFYSVQFSPDGKKLAAGSKDGSVYLWDAQSKKLSKVLKTSNQQREIWSLSFNPKNNQQLAAASDDGYVYLWDLQSGNPPTKMNLKQPDDQALSVSFSQDGQFIAILSANHNRKTGDFTATLWNRQNKPKPKNITDRMGITSISFSPDNNQLATGLQDGTVLLKDLNGNVKQKMLEEDAQDMVASISFSPDGQLLATGSEDGSIRVWDLHNSNPPDINSPNSPVEEFKDKQNKFISVSLSPKIPNTQDRWLAVASTKGGAYLQRIRDLNSLLNQACKEFRSYLNPDSKVKENLKACKK